MSMEGEAENAVMALRGRRYLAAVEITYLGGTLPDDLFTVLVAAIRRDLGEELTDVSLRSSARQHSTLAVSPTTRADNPLEAVTWLDGAVDRTLMGTGLFEEFDVSGKVLRVAPEDPAA